MKAAETLPAPVDQLIIRPTAPRRGGTLRVARERREHPVHRRLAPRVGLVGSDDCRDGELPVPRSTYFRSSPRRRTRFSAIPR